VTGAPRVSLLMPVHNRAHLLDQVLDRLVENTTYENVELVTVDDGSTDGSTEMLRRFAASGRFPSVNLIEHSRSRGAIASLNAALDAASGELCVQLDDDVTIETPGWIERMVEFIQLEDAVGVVTGKVVFDSGDIHACGVNVVGEAGWHERTTTPAEPIGKRQWISRVEQRVPEGEGGEIERLPAEVDSGIGCCMMYRRADALAVGGYDPNWSPVWFDDVDLCLKIRTLGRKVFYTPEVRVIHHFVARRVPDRNLRERLKPRRVAAAIVRRVGKLLPQSVRRAVERRVNIDLLAHYTIPQCALLRHHHAYWRERWGWDARNPDMAEVRRRWGGTEICWATDPERRAAGERIVEAFETMREQRAIAAS
jgi:GT2 family glycosyltransferase